MKKNFYAFIGKMMINAIGLIFMALFGMILIIAIFGSEQPMRSYNKGEIGFKEMIDKTMDSVLDGMGCPQVSTNSVNKK